MRLLWTEDDGSFVLTRNLVKEEEVPEYAILSHTWLAESEEVNFDDMINGTAYRKTRGVDKIRFCAEQAAKDGLQYIWVDTCCINRMSSQELQEPITSMYEWYKNATRCYVYLTDVSVHQEEGGSSTPPRQWEAAFRRSRWHKRGWCLQELLAPTSVEFYSLQGTRLGDKKSLQQYIHEVTGIPCGALQGEPLTHFTVAERLSWAETRQTTRKEDQAYCLLGILAIFMPLMYGEGDHAFTRLQEEIQRRQTESHKLGSQLENLPTTPSAAFNSPDNQDKSTCLPNTKVEILRDISEWADGMHDSCIFWLHGIAGTGKSTIARTIARTYYDQRSLGELSSFPKAAEMRVTLADCSQL